MNLLQIDIGEHLERWLVNLGVQQGITSVIKDMTDFIIMIFLITLVYYIVKLVVLRIIHRIAHKSSATWDDALFQNKVFHQAALLIPGMLFNVFAPFTLTEFPDLLFWSLLIVRIYLVLVTISTVNKFLNALYDIYQGFEISKSKPVKGYLQVLKIIIYIIAGIVIISLLFGRSPVFLLTGLGAFSAVLLLIFKDPILGFVASIQISANDMVRPGDWVSMHKSGADGEVIDISLTTVKVQNWDKSIAMIPTYSLVSESLINWRGMTESGGRRVKRSIVIDQHTVKFCTSEMLERFRKIDLIKDYIDRTENELAVYNQENAIDNSEMVNGRRQTNLGVFRAYLVAYLNNLSTVNKEMPCVVHQLQPGSEGIPIEVYFFSKVMDWSPYEDLQSDLFDHILASVEQFELQVFQKPSGNDYRTLAQA